MKDRIDAFVTRADEVTAEHWKQMGYTYSAPPTHRADFISDKWARVVVLEERNGKREPTSVYCFICLQDGFTKTLGALKAGDIHKAAGFKAPAKHARGSVFSDDFGKCLTAHGIVYLK